MRKIDGSHVSEKLLRAYIAYRGYNIYSLIYYLCLYVYMTYIMKCLWKVHGNAHYEKNCACISKSFYTKIMLPPYPFFHKLFVVLSYMNVQITFHVTQNISRGEYNLSSLNPYELGNQFSFGTWEEIEAICGCRK